MRLSTIWIHVSTVLFLLLNTQELEAKSKNKKPKSAPQAAPAYVLTEKEQQLVQHVKESIELAERGVSKVDPAVLAIEGMTSATIQHFLNNVCSLPGTAYLEIGCWKGATLVGALSGNESTLSDAVAIENFSLFGGPREDFLRNIRTFVPRAPLRFIEKDCFSVDKKSDFIRPITVYFYDGGHAFLEQYKAFTEFNEVLDDLFVAIVDDWNWGEVRDGTVTAFKDLGYKVLYERPFYGRSSRNAGRISSA